MAGQGGAGGRAAQREALARRPGEQRILAQDRVEQGEAGAGAESRLEARVGADGWLFRRPRPTRKYLLEQRVRRRGTRRGEPPRSPPRRGDRRFAERIGGGSFVIERVGGIESDHAFTITKGGALSCCYAKKPPRLSDENNVR